MRFLEIPALSLINNALGVIEMPDGSQMRVRVEAYSCKMTSDDRKILKKLAATSSNEDLQQSLEDEDEHVALSNEDLVKRKSSQKIFSYLVGAMNSAFPDYDFSNVHPDCFEVQPSLGDVIHNVNTTLFNVGIAGSNSNRLAQFNQTLWQCIDEAIQVYTEADCQIYSYNNQMCDFDLLNDDGCVWSFNYLFFNRKLKRTLLFVCRQVTQDAEGADSALGSGGLSGSSGKSSLYCSPTGEEGHLERNAAGMGEDYYVLGEL